MLFLSFVGCGSNSAGLSEGSVQPIVASGSDRAVLTIYPANPTGETIHPELFGVNISARVEPGWSGPFQNSGDEQYLALMKELDWPFIRINMGGRLMGEIFPYKGSAPVWGGLDLLIANIGRFHQGPIMVTLGRVPSWVDIASPVGRSDYASLAKNIAERFFIGGVDVALWEVINEPESLTTGTFEDVCLLFNETSVAIRGVFPSAAIGGPVLAWPRAELIERFLFLSGYYADFVSYHQYGTGDLAKPTALLMDEAVKFRDSASMTMGLIKKYQTYANEVTLTEYNMNYGWEPYTDPRQATVVGAVYAALALGYAAEGGVTKAALWEAFGDGTFGAIGFYDYSIRPVGRMLSMMAKQMPGAIVVSTFEGTGKLKAVASRGPGGRLSVLLVNYGEDEDIFLTMDISGFMTSGLAGFSVFELGPSHPSGSLFSGAKEWPKIVTVPAMSVLILQMQ